MTRTPRMHLPLATLALSALSLSALSACATGPARFPVTATRYHFDPVATRGTIAIVPDQNVTADLEYQAFADAVAAELARQGYTVAPAAAPGQPRPENLATVGFSRTARALPPRGGGVQLGLGGGGYSGGAGVGGGISVPLGGRRARPAIAAELSVRIRRGPDAIWEGRAQSLTEAAAPDAQTPAIAQRLATALFTGFPGESGRTIEIE